MPNNAIKEVYTKGVPEATGDVISIEMDGRSSMTYKLANIGLRDGKAVTVELQDSDDGISYATVAGTSETVVPGGAVNKAIETVRKFFKFVGSGGNEVQIELSVEQQTHLIDI